MRKTLARVFFVHLTRPRGKHEEKRRKACKVGTCIEITSNVNVGYEAGQGRGGDTSYVMTGEAGREKPSVLR